MRLKNTISLAFEQASTSTCSESGHHTRNRYIGSDQMSGRVSRERPLAFSVS